jgi:hypothetical protein
MPDQMDLGEIPDGGIAENEHMVVKDKIILKSLTIDQKARANKE